MKNLINYIKTKTSSEKKARIIGAVENNPKLVLSVCEKRNMVLMSNQDGTTDALQLDPDDFDSALKAVKQEIKTRPNEEDRVEWWECNTLDGVYSYEIERSLIESRRGQTTQKKRHIDKRKLNDLCRTNGVPPGMEKLYLAELILDQNPINDSARQQAKLLGLMPT